MNLTDKHKANENKDSFHSRSHNLGNGDNVNKEENSTSKRSKRIYSSKEESNNKVLKSILKKESSIRPTEEDWSFLEEDDEDREQKEIEARRKRRQTILEKHQHLKLVEKENFTSSPDIDTSFNSPLIVSKNINKFNNSPNSEDNNCSAVDYNPDLDRLEEANRHHNAGVKDDFLEKHINKQSEHSNTDDLDDDFDMFGDNILSETKIKMTKVPLINNKFNQTNGLLDNWDDEEGYYKVTIREVLNERYQVCSTLGKGVFSTVIKAKDIMENDKEVAIKIIRCNDVMRKLGHKEMDILNKLSKADPNDKKHIVRMLSHFEYRNHLCIVFESLSINLREVLKKYGKDVGISIKAVRAYAKQLILALSLLEKCNIVHADIKPDNILVSENHNYLKLCDLGSASLKEDNEITPYLVSRFYRAPEIILGLPYGFSIDMWSIGCSLFEMYTGKILFPGRDNNHMLKLIMDLKGRFPNKMIKKGIFSNRHFDQDFLFLFNDAEKGLIKPLNISKLPPKELKSRILKVSTDLDEQDSELVTHFISFLDRCININPEHRISVKEAFNHPFLN